MFGRQSIRALIESDREFMRELVLRMERSERAILADAAETRRVLAERMASEEQRIIAEIAASRREFSEEMQRIHREFDEGRAEQRAGREALLRILDRLDRLDPGDATA